MKINLNELTIQKARAMLVAGEITASELLEACKIQVKEKNPELHAFLETFDDVRSDNDEHVKRADVPLAGIPIAMKDNILITGHRASASSKILEHYVAPYDATVTRLLREAGAVFVGRTNMDEFAMGSSTENSAFGRTKNPLDPERVPGGSSGGSAAAVAMGAALASMGTDTGGSIRQPAAFCGLVGLYPTYGTVSRYGLIAMGSSLDQAGPMTRSVADAKLIWSVIAKHDPLDARSIPDQYRVPTVVNEKRLGIPAGLLDQPGIADDVRKNFMESVEKLKSAGYEIVDVPMPNIAYGLAVYYIVMPAEVSSNLARFDGIRYGTRGEHNDLLSLYNNSRGTGFGAETRRRVLLGTYVLSSGYYDAYYGKALAVRDLIRKDYEDAFKTVQAIITPTTPTTAFRAGEKSDPVSMYMADMFTVPANLAGIPAISIPSGKGDDDMPIGIHFAGPQFSEETLFEIGSAFEGVRGDV